jgi:DNA-binding protein YbaB
MRENHDMEEITQSAHALKKEVNGYSKSIETRSNGGTALSTLVKVSIEYGPALDDVQVDCLDQMFKDFWDSIMKKF